MKYGNNYLSELSSDFIYVTYFIYVYYVEYIYVYILAVCIKS